jgi:hypothetical protein
MTMSPYATGTDITTDTPTTSDNSCSLRSKRTLVRARSLLTGTAEKMTTAVETAHFGPSSVPVVDTPASAHDGQHKALKKVSIVDCATATEIIPNSEPMKLDNECFTGHVMLLVRTPDVDSAKEPVPTGETPARVSKYFKGYKRRFEFQFQIKLKKVPTGPLFLGCEVEEMIKINRWTKGMASFLLAMIRRINPGFQ